MGLPDWLRYEIHTSSQGYRAHTNISDGLYFVPECRDVPHVWNFGVSTVVLLLYATLSLKMVYKILLKTKNKQLLQTEN